MKSSQEKFVEFLIEAAKLKKRIERQALKYKATHELLGYITPQNGFALFNKETGKMERVLRPAVRFNPETSKREIVQVPHTRFIGWDYGKKYTGEKLRKLRQERASA